MSRRALRDTEQAFATARVAYESALEESLRRDEAHETAKINRDDALSNRNFTAADIAPHQTAYEQALAAMNTAEQDFQKARKTYIDIRDERRQRYNYLEAKQDARSPIKQVSSFPKSLGLDLADIIGYHCETFNDALAESTPHFWQVAPPTGSSYTDEALRRRINQTRDKQHINYRRWIRDRIAFRMVYDNLRDAGFTFTRHQDTGSP